MPVTVNGISCTLAGGVRETTQTTGTGTYSLDGAATVDGITYRTGVAAIGSGTTSVWTARLGSSFETFIGTVTAGTPAMLTRSTILESSNANNAVSWGAGVKDIFIDAAAAVFHSLQSTMDTTLFASVKVTVRTTTGTFTKDAKCLQARVRIVGAGGGGGGTTATDGTESASGAGGGGGEYAEGYFTSATIGASQTVTIGAGGTAASGANGGTGGTTSFGALMTALGGSGGEVGTGTSLNATEAGGAGGSGGTGGSFRVAGSDGGNGSVRAGVQGADGYGGASLLSGERAAFTAQGGSTGKLYGGGGSGASSNISTAARTGGVGGTGICIIEEYLSR